MGDSQTLTCDVAVIGAGTAGLAATRAALETGAHVLLIDEAFAGTVCANVGCMPSKLLIAAAQSAHAVQSADIFGVHAKEVSINGREVMARVRRERDKFVAATLKGIEALPSGICIKARARFTGPTRLALDDGRTIEAKTIIIATGARPVVPKPFQALGDIALTHETIFEIADLPRALAVVGGGAIGLELAQAFARLGVKTALFDKEETLGGITDPDAQAALQSIIAEDVDLHLGVDVKAVPHGAEAELSWSGAASGSRRFDTVLLATGRPPYFEGLGLDATGLALDEHGVPKFARDTLQCGQSPTFIAGDVNADAPVLHEASSQGRIAGANAARFPNVAPAPRHMPFKMIFTDPPVAVIGSDPNDNTIVGRASYSDQGRAKVEARNTGLVRLYADPEKGCLTGAVLIAPGADHMAHWLVGTIAAGLTATEMLALPFYHPTLEEGLKPALREICNAIPASGDIDNTSPPGA